MKTNGVIFFITYFMITISVKASKDTNMLKLSNQQIKPGNLYDYFYKRFENLQNNFEENFSHQDYMQKRTINGKYAPLYDEFKKRLDNFKSVLLLDKDQQPLAEENCENLLKDSLNTKTNTNDNMERSNRGFLKYFGFKEHAKEVSKPIKKNKAQKKGQQLNRENLNFVGIKPGNLYDEYKRQIDKILK